MFKPFSVLSSQGSKANRKPAYRKPAKPALTRMTKPEMESQFEAALQQRAEQTRRRYREPDYIPSDVIQKRKQTIPHGTGRVSWIWLER